MCMIYSLCKLFALLNFKTKRKNRFKKSKVTPHYFFYRTWIESGQTF